jgi:Xaa-Pro dipeptidase
MERLDRLQEQLAHRGLDCLALVPGANLFYLTGLQFFLSERPVVAFFPLDAAPAIVLPELEAAKLESEDVPEIEAFTYTDEEGYTGAFQQACAALELADSIIGIEAFRMRVAELRLLERYAPNSQIVPGEELMAALRMTKEAGELEAQRRAIAITEQALREIVARVRPGMTERQIAGDLGTALLSLGAESVSFDPLVLSGPTAPSRTRTPRPRGARQRDPALRLRRCGRRLQSDITRTFFVSQPTPSSLTSRCGQAATPPAWLPRARAWPAGRCRRARSSRPAIASISCTAPATGLAWRARTLPSCAAAANCSNRHGVHLEPGIYLPGKGGVRIEDDARHRRRAESLTTYPRELTVIG